MASFDALVKSVVESLSAATPRDTVELGVIHGFCIDAAHPNVSMVDFLSSVGGLEALSAQLSRLPEHIEAVDIDGSLRKFVPKAEPPPS
jgi:hypothetical protein